MLRLTARRFLLPMSFGLLSALVPALVMAQASPFLTGATALQTNLLAWLTPIAVILVMALGAMGHGESHVLGLVHRSDCRHRHRVWRAADRYLGTRNVRRVMSHGRSQPRFDREPLFVGATRPPMRWGVTYSALLSNTVFTMESFLVTRNLLTLFVCIPIHAACVLLCARDPRFFDLLALWLRVRLPMLFANRGVWRANSYGPLALPRRKRARLAVEWPCL